MAEIELFSTETSFDTTNPPASPAAVQGSSALQDIIIEPAAATRGRRPSRVAPAHTSRHRGTPLPSPPRRQPPSPASSFTSAVSYVPAAENWTIAGLRQVLTSSGVTIPSRSTKPDLLALYASLQSGELPNSSPPFKAVPKASQGRSVPYARPKQTTTSSRISSRPLGRIRRPSASLGQTPDAAAISPHAPSRATEHELATHSGKEPAFASTSRRARASTPPLAAKNHPKPRPHPTPNPLPYPWPAAPPHSYSTSTPPQSAQTPAPTIPPLSPPPLFSAYNAYPSTSTQPLPAPTATFPPPSARGPFSLSSATPLPIPPNAPALEPAPVANSIRTQILSEIQNVGTRGGHAPNPGTSLFRADIPINHPLKPLLEASLNSIFQAVSPRTLQSYLTAWKCFKHFHSAYNLPFPDFSLLSVTSFISHLNANKNSKSAPLKVIWAECNFSTNFYMALLLPK